MLKTLIWCELIPISCISVSVYYLQIRYERNVGNARNNLMFLQWHQKRFHMKTRSWNFWSNHRRITLDLDTLYFGFKNDLSLTFIFFNIQPKPPFLLSFICLICSFNIKGLLCTRSAKWLDQYKSTRTDPGLGDWMWLASWKYV